MKSTSKKTAVLVAIILSLAAHADYNKNRGVWINAKLPNSNISFLDKGSIAGGSIGVTCDIHNHLLKLNYTFTSGSDLSVFEDTPIENVHDVSIYYGYLFRVALTRRQSILFDASCGIGWAQGTVKGRLIPSTDWFSFGDDYEEVELSGPVYKIMGTVLYSPGRHFGVGPFFEYNITRIRDGFTAGIAFNAGFHPNWSE